MSSSLLVKPDLSPAARQVHRITPESAGWRYVGFGLLTLVAGSVAYWLWTKRGVSA